MIAVITSTTAIHFKKYVEIILVVSMHKKINGIVLKIFETIPSMFIRAIGSVSFYV